MSKLRHKKPQGTLQQPVQRSVRETIASTIERWEIVLLFLFAFVLRIIGIGWGLPNADHLFSYHPDEIFVLQPALRMLEGDWNPHFFNYGTLYLYLVGIASYLFALIGMSPAATGDLALLYLIGRLISAFLGAGTVVLVYLIGRDIGSRRLGVWASLILTIIPLHLVNSHFATVDVPATFFLTLGAWACVRIMQNGKLLWYLIAGAAMGCAMATKYTLAFGILLVIGAHFLRGKQPTRQHGYLLLALLMFPLFFLIGNPYALSFDGGLQIRDEFLRGIRFESQHMREVRTAAFVGTGSGWAYHALRGMPAALGWPLYVFALVSMVLSFCRAGLPCPALLSKNLRLIAVWSMIFFLIIGFATERFIRYLVPLMPFMALYVAVVIELVAGRQKGGAWQPRPTTRVAFFIIIPLCLLISLCYSFFQLWLLVAPDPRDKAISFIRTLQPQRIGVQEVPWFRTPPVSPYNAGGVSRAEFEKWQKTAPYQVAVTAWSTDTLRQTRPDVFVVSDLQYRDELRLGDSEVKQFLNTLDMWYAEKQAFENPAAWDTIGGGKRLAPPDWLYLKPKITVYSGWKHDR